MAIRLEHGSHRSVPVASCGIETDTSLFSQNSINIKFNGWTVISDGVMVPGIEKRPIIRNQYYAASTSVDI